MIVTIITVILALSFLVFIHELGHFLAAKKVGVHVIEFSIGFPPKLYSKIVGKTEYMVSAIPVGGYVRLKGQGIDDEDPSDPENYASKSVWQRFLILVSGAMMNLLVTLVFIPLVFFIGYKAPAYLYNTPEIGKVDKDSKAFLLDIHQGDIILSVNQQSVNNWKEVQSALHNPKGEYTTITLKRGEENLVRQFSTNYLNTKEGFGWSAKIAPVIGNVSPGSPAEKAGLQEGDHLLQVNGDDLQDWSQISPLVQKTDGKPVQLKFERDRKVTELEITPTWESNQNYWVIGIGSQTTHVSENLKDSVVLGVERVYYLTSRTFEFLFRLLTGKEKSEAVGGPIMIAKMMGEAAQTGISSLLTLVAFISLQFAIFNLLPIPALDGGHIFFLIVEKITGRSLSKNLRLSIQRVGFSLLMLLILYISVQDGIRLFTG